MGARGYNKADEREGYVGEQGWPRAEDQATHAPSCHTHLWADPSQLVCTGSLLRACQIDRRNKSGFPSYVIRLDSLPRHGFESS